MKNKPQFKTIFFTAVITIVSTLGVIVGLLMLDSSYIEPSAEVAIEDTATEEEVEPLIIDEHNVATMESRAFILEKIIPIANKHFQVESLEISYIEFDEDNHSHYVNMTVSNESLGKLMAVQHSLFHDEEVEELQESVASSLERVSELLSFTFDDNVSLSFKTKDMGKFVFIKLSPSQIIELDSFELTKQVWEWEE